MSKVIRLNCGSVANFNRRVDELIKQALPHTDGMKRKPRRLSGTLRVYDQIHYIIHLFEQTKPDCWWVKLVLLCVRLLSTALMVFFNDQVTQVRRRMICLAPHNPTLCIYHGTSPGGDCWFDIARFPQLSRDDDPIPLRQRQLRGADGATPRIFIHVFASPAFGWGISHGISTFVDRCCHRCRRAGIRCFYAPRYCEGSSIAH